MLLSPGAGDIGQMNEADLQGAFLLLLLWTVDWLPPEDMSELLVRQIFREHFALVTAVFLGVAHRPITELIIGEKINNAGAYRE